MPIDFGALGLGSAQGGGRAAPHPAHPRRLVLRLGGLSSRAGGLATALEDPGDHQAPQAAKQNQKNGPAIAGRARRGVDRDATMISGTLGRPADRAPRRT
jgi:hypothetical protein